MNSDQLTAFFRELISLIAGIVFLIGAILNWNWMNDPTQKPHANRYSRGERRIIFFLLGIVLIVVSIWSFLLKLKKRRN